MLPERAASPVARARARVGRSRLRRAASGLSNLSLARRFLLVSLALVVVGGAAVAWVLGQLIETSAINRTTSVTALYVESFVAPELQSLANTSSLTQPEIDSLQNLLSPNSPVGNQVVAFRIWSTDGTILYAARTPNSWAETSGWRATGVARRRGRSPVTSAI